MVRLVLPGDDCWISTQAKLSKSEIMEKATDAKKLEQLAKAAEVADRHEDMSVFMQMLVKKKEYKDITLEQRNLFSVAWKNAVGARRDAWRTLNETVDDKNAEMVESFKRVVKADMKATCDEVQEILKKLVENIAKIEEAGEVPKEDDDKKKFSEDKIFWFKMRADYYRYLSEVFGDNQEYKDGCATCYGKAMKEAEANLEPTNPTRLGLALNYSVCKYEILGEKEAACKLAQSAFDAAIDKLDHLQDGTYRDSTNIMQLLRDNLTIWKDDKEEEPEN